MPLIKFTLSDGVRDIEAQPGLSVMQAAVQAEVPGIIAECNGDMSCATCHVYLTGDPGFRPMSADEDDLLELVDDRADNSRLACQLKLSESMTEVLVSVPS